METTELDPLEALGVDPTASFKEIRAAWRRRLFECHPDHGGSNEATREVNDAWAKVSDPEKLAAAREERLARDATRRAARTPPPRTDPPPPRTERPRSEPRPRADPPPGDPPPPPPPRSSARPRARRPRPPRSTPPPWTPSRRTRTQLKWLARAMLVGWLLLAGPGWYRHHFVPPPEVVEQHGPVQSIATVASECPAGEVTVEVGRAGTSVVVEITDPTITNELGPDRSWAVDVDGRDGRLLNVNGIDTTATVRVGDQMREVTVAVGEGDDPEVVDVPVRVDARAHRITLNLAREHFPTTEGALDWAVSRVVGEEATPICSAIAPAP